MGGGQRRKGEGEEERGLEVKRGEEGGREVKGREGREERDGRERERRRGWERSGCHKHEVGQDLGEQKGSKHCLRKAEK